MTTSQTAISEQQFVVFRLAEEEFALVLLVREIIKVTEITRLPHVAKYIEGVTNLRGEV